MTPSIVFPEVKRDERIQQALSGTYKQWRIAYDAAHPAPPILNAVFCHDILWRENWLSIQNAHDLKATIWKVAFAAMFLAQWGHIVSFIVSCLYG